MTSQGAHQRLVVFARAPVLGRVKTRLSPPLSELQTLELHRALVEDTLERLARFQRPHLEYWLYVSEPPPAGALDVPAPWRQALQVGDDLGARMESTLRDGFERGCDRVVILGSDSPTVPLDSLHEAYRSLMTHDAVLGPAEDGGCYLIGFSRMPPGLFRDVTWGSALVLDQLTQALTERELSLHLLPSWYDVDTAEDLGRLRSDLDRLRATGRDLPHRTAQALSDFFGKGKIPS